MLPTRSHARLAAVSHPSLGRPPLDLRAGHPVDAAALKAATARVADRALEAAVAADPTLRERYDDVQLRGLLADLRAFVGRLGIAIAADDASVMVGWAENIAVRYRKRVVPMDDVIALCEGLRLAVLGVCRLGSHGGEHDGGRCNACKNSVQRRYQIPSHGNSLDLGFHLWPQGVLRTCFQAITQNPMPMAN